MGKLRQAVLGFVLTLLPVSYAVAIEETKYTVLLKEGDLELREYAPYIIAQTLVNGGFEEAGDTAFRKLFDYITGENHLEQDVEMTVPVGQTQVDAGKKIEMTAPVGQTQLAGQWAVSFMMPASYTLETLPKPNNKDVTLEKIPGRKVATITYSGFWDEEGYLKNKEILMKWLVGKNLVQAGEPIWARYNPPIMPWFLRRNEILIPIRNVRQKQ